MSMADFGYSPLRIVRPREDLLVELYNPDSWKETFICYLSELPAEFNIWNVYWRYTGIAKEQLSRERSVSWRYTGKDFPRIEA